MENTFNKEITMLRKLGHHWYRVVLFLLFLGVWVWSANNPHHTEAWILENVLIFIFVPIVLFAGKYFRFSNTSYTFIALFAMLHLMGAHYTYANTPLGDILGQWLGTDRNMYDRLVHFAFGLLLAFPIREVLMRVAKMRGFWAYFLPLDMTLSVSALFEIIEWLIADIFAPSAQTAYLATQGDIWDPQKDMLMAGLGAFTTLVIIALVNWRYSSEFRREWKQSFRLDQQHRPAGEVRPRDVFKHERERLKNRRARKTLHR